MSNKFIYHTMLLLLGVAAVNVAVGSITLVLIAAGLSLVGWKITGAFFVAWAIILYGTARWFLEAA